MIILDGILDLVFPRKCVLCQQPLDNGETDLCRACRTAAPVHGGTAANPYGIDFVIPVWYYTGSARKSLLRYKFNGKRGYADAYGRLLGMLVSRISGIDVITWVPVSQKRKRKRGYDQSELLAKAVGREVGLPVRPFLKKQKDNPAQSGISDAAKRKENVKGAYCAVNEREIPGKRVLLVDDILTTGATASECAGILRKAGASTVLLAVMAAGQEKHHPLE